MMAPPSTFEIDIHGLDDDDPRIAFSDTTTMPSGLEKHLTQAEWNDFRSQINRALQEYTTSKTQARYLNWALFIVVGLLCIVVTLLVTTADNNVTAAAQAEEQQEEADIGGQQQEWQDDSPACELDDGCNSTTSTASAAAVSPLTRHLAPILIVLPLFVVMATVAGKWSLRSAHDDSLNKVRQVCWEFSCSKPNMMVQLLSRHLEDHGESSSSLLPRYRRLRRPAIRRIWYIEFWFSARDPVPLSFTQGDKRSSFSSLVYEPPNRAIAPIVYAATG